MKVLFIVPYPPQGASNRFRVLQFLPFLHQEGIRTRVRPFYSDAFWRILYQPGRYPKKFLYGLICSLNRVLDLLRSISYDIVFIHRESFPIGPAWFEWLLQLLGRPYVYDFDDAIFLPNVAESNRALGRLKCPGKVASIVRGSRVTIAGNNYLAEFAGRAGARKIEILPTVVDTALFVPQDKGEEKNEVVIGWIGSPTTIEFLENFRPVIDKVLTCCQGEARFLVVGGHLTGELQEGINYLPWSLESEIALLQKFDIGIMPMPDNQWTRGKCAFKAIEYMAVGIPAVCSPVGMNLELIDNTVNGFLAEDEKQWVDILCRLVHDEALRHKVGEAGRRLVEARYSLLKAAPRFKAVILDAARV